MAAPDAPDPRTLIGGRYAIALDSPLGRGGMCLVYRGLDTRSRREVAVKTLRLEYRRDPESRARFRREARLIAFLAHPNVIRVVDFIDDRGTSWVVMEHVPGQTVSALVASRGAQSINSVVLLLDQAASALDDLHHQGLVHLDVKPQNILISPDGELKLIDFGLAQPLGVPQVALNSHTAGAIGYVAPEQLRGESVGPAADIYGLGAVVYELLTGLPPYPTSAGTEVTNTLIRTRLSQMPLPPTLANPAARLPAWVDDVVLWALALDPRARYGSAGAFAEVFRAGVEGEPLVAPRPAEPMLIEVAGAVVAPGPVSAPPSAPGGSEPATSPDIVAAANRAGAAARRRPAADEAPAVPAADAEPDSGDPALPATADAEWAAPWGDDDDLSPPPLDAVTVPTHIGRRDTGALSRRRLPSWERLQRWLWLAVGVLVALNLVVAMLLLVSRGRLFGF